MVHEPHRSPPCTPEHTQQSQHEHDRRMRELQMSSPSACCAQQFQPANPPALNSVAPDYHPGQYPHGIPQHLHHQHPYGYQPLAPMPMPAPLPANPPALNFVAPDYHPGQYLHGLPQHLHHQHPYGYQPFAPMPMPAPLPAHHHSTHAPVPTHAYPG